MALPTPGPHCPKVGMDIKLASSSFHQQAPKLKITSQGPGWTIFLQQNPKKVQFYFTKFAQKSSKNTKFDKKYTPSEYIKWVPGEPPVDSL